jgi:hypothetical protein
MSEAVNAAFQPGDVVRYKGESTEYLDKGYLYVARQDIYGCLCVADSIFSANFAIEDSPELFALVLREEPK